MLLNSSILLSLLEGGSEMPANERRAASILLVDDDPQMLNFLCEHLSSRGFLVRSALSAGKALETAKEEPPDLMICDLKMPLVDGITCMETFQRIDPSLQVIMLSGEATIDNAVSAMKKGAFDFLQKPVIMDSLFCCIEKALLKKRLEATILACGRAHQILDAKYSDDLFRSVAPLLAQYVSAAKCALFLLDEKGLWRSVSAVGLDDSGSLRVAENFIKNFSGPENFGTKPSLLAKRGRNPAPWMIVPLLHQERLLGAFYMTRDETQDEFSASDMREAATYTLNVTQVAESIRTEKTLSERMTELKRAHESLETFKDLLSHKERLAQLGNMVAVIAHEINNPLAAILGYAELLLGSASANLETREHLEIVHSEAERCKTMLREVLMYSRQRKPKFTNTPLRKIVTDVLSVMRPETDRQGAHILIDAQTDEIEVLGDADLLKQVFLNLIKNALQAMGTQKEKELKIGLSCRGGFATITFRDHGPGIPPEALKKIFDPYFTTKSAGNGTGLGLTVTSQIVREHHGCLTAYNCADGGAVFCVKLPCGSSNQTQSLDQAA